MNRGITSNVAVDARKCFVGSAAPYPMKLLRNHKISTGDALVVIVLEEMKEIASFVGRIAIMARWYFAKEIIAS